MAVSEKMVDAAVRKATDAGLLPRRCSAADHLLYRSLIREILEAALDEELGAVLRHSRLPKDAI